MLSAMQYHICLCCSIATIKETRMNVNSFTAVFFIYSTSEQKLLKRKSYSNKCERIPECTYMIVQTLLNNSSWVGAVQTKNYFDVKL